MASFVRLDWNNWIYGLFAGFIGGGAGAVVSGVTASMLAPDKLALGGSRFFALIGIVFLVHGAISTAMFLQQNPLPKQLTVTDESASKSVTTGVGPDKTTTTTAASKTTTVLTEEPK